MFRPGAPLRPGKCLLMPTLVMPGSAWTARRGAAGQAAVLMAMETGVVCMLRDPGFTGPQESRTAGLAAAQGLARGRTRSFWSTSDGFRDVERCRRTRVRGVCSPAPAMAPRSEWPGARSGSLHGHSWPRFIPLNAQAREERTGGAERTRARRSASLSSRRMARVRRRYLFSGRRSRGWRRWF